MMKHSLEPAFLGMAIGVTCLFSCVAAPHPVGLGFAPSHLLGVGTANAEDGCAEAERLKSEADSGGGSTGDRRRRLQEAAQRCPRVDMLVAQAHAEIADGEPAQALVTLNGSASLDRDPPDWAAVRLARTPAEKASVKLGIARAAAALGRRWDSRVFYQAYLAVQPGDRQAARELLELEWPHRDETVPAREISAALALPRSMKRDYDIRPRASVRVNFDYDSAELTASGARQADEMVTALKQLIEKSGDLPRSASRDYEITSSKRIQVIGHTDLHGSDEYNLDLSRRRAETIRRYLAGRGVKADLLVVEARGEREPLLAEEGERADTFNRRVEFRMP